MSKNIKFRLKSWNHIVKIPVNILNDSEYFSNLMETFPEKNKFTVSLLHTNIKKNNLEHILEYLLNDNDTNKYCIFTCNLNKTEYVKFIETTKIPINDLIEIAVFNDLLQFNSIRKFIRECVGDILIFFHNILVPNHFENSRRKIALKVNKHRIDKILFIETLCKYAFQEINVLKLCYVHGKYCDSIHNNLTKTLISGMKNTYTWSLNSVLNIDLKIFWKLFNESSHNIFNFFPFENAYIPAGYQSLTIGIPTNIFYVDIIFNPKRDIFEDILEVLEYFVSLDKDCIFGLIDEYIQIKLLDINIFVSFTDSDYLIGIIDTDTLSDINDVYYLCLETFANYTEDTNDYETMYNTTTNTSIIEDYKTVCGIINEHSKCIDIHDIIYVEKINYTINNFGIHTVTFNNTGLFERILKECNKKYIKINDTIVSFKETLCELIYNYDLHLNFNNIFYLGYDKVDNNTIFFNFLC
jgi:hypothetical protein